MPDLIAFHTSSIRGGYPGLPDSKTLRMQNLHKGMWRLEGKPLVDGKKAVFVHIGY